MRGKAQARRDGGAPRRSWCVVPGCAESGKHANFISRFNVGAEGCHEPQPRLGCIARAQKISMRRGRKARQTARGSERSSQHISPARTVCGGHGCQVQGQRPSRQGAHGSAAPAGTFKHRQAQSTFRHWAHMSDISYALEQGAAFARRGVRCGGR